MVNFNFNKIGVKKRVNFCVVFWRKGKPPLQEQIRGTAPRCVKWIELHCILGWENSERWTIRRTSIQATPVPIEDTKDLNCKGSALPHHAGFHLLTQLQLALNKWWLRTENNYPTIFSLQKGNLLMIPMSSMINSIHPTLSFTPPLCEI